MTSDTGHGMIGADIRAKLDHPIIDADGHMFETTFAILDFVKQVGGADLAARYEKVLMGSSGGPSRRAVWTANSGAATIDRVTAMLPELFRKRLDDTGLDFCVVYGTVALSVLRIGDDELRSVVYRAMNTMYADMFGPFSDRMTPAALIPMHDPVEAVAELDYVVNELGLKAIVMNTMIYRPAPEVVKEAPHLAEYSMVPHSPAIDAGDTYDPVWAKCIELGVVPSCHNSFRGRGSTHGSPTNYVYNSMGSFGQGGEYFCRSLFFGGVPKRFPELKFSFLEAGVGWAPQFYNSLFEYWEKRNLEALKKNLDPAKLDIDLMIEMFEKYGNDYLTADRIRAQPYQPISSNLLVPPEEVNDFAPTGIEKPKDIRDIFDANFYFGCEADDRLNAIAFDTRLNHYGARLNAIFGSDIGHWDVPDMTKVLGEARELVEHELITEDDFSDFTFGNAANMLGGMNPDFFKNTIVEDAVDAHLAKTAPAAAE
jgi:predicted TIM-barrel fold metal-dependent hydrolase